MEEKSRKTAEFRQIVKAVRTLAKVDRIGSNTFFLFMVIWAMATDCMVLFVWIGHVIRFDPVTTATIVVAAMTSLYLSWIGAGRRSVRTQRTETHALLVMIVATVALVSTVILSAEVSKVAMMATITMVAMTVFHAALTLAKAPAVAVASRVEDAVRARYTDAEQGELLLKIAGTWRRTGIKGGESSLLYGVLDPNVRNCDFPPGPIILMNFRMCLFGRWADLQIAFQLERAHFSAAGLVVATQCASFGELEACLRELLNNRMETLPRRKLPLERVNDLFQAAWLSLALSLPWTPSGYPYYRVARAWINRVGPEMDHPVVKPR
jgi:hypothetical protein